MEKISTTKLASGLSRETKDVFNKLKEEHLIYFQDKNWHLTKKGIEYGGELINSVKYGDFIVWPQDLNPFELNVEKGTMINSTNIGKHFEISGQRMNLILAELGWIQKSVKGWETTNIGERLGGHNLDHFTSGASYVVWPESILDNKSLKNSLSKDHDVTEEIASEVEDFRNKYPAKLRTKDGHLVRSRAELLIDNSLYDYGIPHAYERRVPVEEEIYSDFYIPSYNNNKPVYIEFWGLEEDPEYQKRKHRKIEIYKINELNLIELQNRHIANLDDHLPRLLLEYSIKVY